jgi:hypothetical protein
MPLCAAAATIAMTTARRQYNGVDTFTCGTSSAFDTSFLNLPSILRHTTLPMPGTATSIIYAVINGLAWPAGLPATIRACDLALSQASLTVIQIQALGFPAVAVPGALTRSSVRRGKKIHICVDVHSPAIASAGVHIGAPAGTYHFSIIYNETAFSYHFVHVCMH